MFQKEFLLIVSFLIVSALNASSQLETIKSDGKNYPPVSIPDTEMRTFFSTILNQEINIYVKLPLSYYNNPQKIYPVGILLMQTDHFRWWQIW